MAGEIDKVAADNTDSKMHAVINFTGEPSDDYVEKIKEFGEELELKHVALTTTNDGGKFKVNEDAEVTVMHYKGKKVKFNYASEKELSEDAVEAIVKGTSEILE